MRGCSDDVSDASVACHGISNTVTGITIVGGRDLIFDIPGIRVWGKTGTATAPARRVDVNGDGILSNAPPDERKIGLDHAWFVGLAGDRADDQPRYAVAVLLEYGGSGGRVAGPLAAEGIRSLVRHGYLQGRSQTRGANGGAS